MTQTITLTGLHCEACTKISVKRLAKISDVQAVVASKPQGTFEITADRFITKGEIIKILEGTEYSVLSV